MGISGYLPSSRISQAGVVADTANRPASPYEGQVLYQKDTNQLLVYDGSAWVMIADTDEPSGMQLVKTQTIGSAVSSVTVTNAFSSTYDNYLITITGGASSVGDNGRLKLGSSTSQHYGLVMYASYALPGTYAGAGDVNAAQFSFCWRTLTTSLYAHIVVSSPYLSEVTYIEGTWVADTAAGKYAGFHDSTTSFTDFTLAPQSGTLTGGTIRVYGYRN